MKKQWDLRTNERHELALNQTEKVTRETRKIIGRLIFDEVRYYNDEDKEFRLSVARSIYSKICKDFGYRFGKIDLQTKLMKVHHLTMNSVIENEYKEILTLKYDNEQLIKRVKFLESITDKRTINFLPEFMSISDPNSPKFVCIP